MYKCMKIKISQYISIRRVFYFNIMESRIFFPKLTSNLNDDVII